jgi:hypothetical protein
MNIKILRLLFGRTTGASLQSFIGQEVNRQKINIVLNRGDVAV